MYEPEWRLPKSKGEALAVLAGAGGDAAAVAGGTDIAPLITGGSRRPRVLVDLGGVVDMSYLSVGDDSIDIGALATHGTLCGDERVLNGAAVLSSACRTVGAPQIRARGTIGGNLANGSPAADGVVALVALDARAIVESEGRGRRDVPLSEFLVGPGQTVLGPDELVTGVTFDRPSGEARGAYRKAGQRNALAIAVASVAVVHEPGAGTVRIALGSVAPTPVRATKAEELFAAGWSEAKNAPGLRELIRETAAAAVRAASPIDDVRASAWYRTTLVEVLTRRALEQACE